MAYPVSATPFPAGSANPSPAYSGTFIPQIWSAKLIEKFYDATVLAAIANTDYEGEISNKGDKVIIRTRPTITIRNYEANQPLQVERPSAPTTELNIDQGRYFNLILDDVMRIQSDLDQMNMWAADASEQMKINVDTWVLSHIAADVSADNTGTTAGRISNDLDLGTAVAPLMIVNDNAGTGETTAIDMLLRMGQALDEQNIPETGRWAVIPPFMARLIKSSELRDASVSGDGTSMLRNGRLGMIDRFTLYGSNHLPLATGKTTIIAGHKQGLTFAAQYTRMETLRSESTFGTLMRGLQVFGHKVIDPTTLVVGIVQAA
jgi:hypothetical protein